MAHLLDIHTALPSYANDKEGLLAFYNTALEATGLPDISKKIRFLLDKTKIDTRYSCVPDFENQANNQANELFLNQDYRPSIEKRMEVYKQKIVPLASKALGPILANNHIKPQDVTHLITVSCTGLYAPGLEFELAALHGLEHTEKLGINFLGCYAAIKALKHAYYIANADPNACVLLVSAELCTLHFLPSVVDEDVIASLLFADGAAAALICGDQSTHLKGQKTLKIDAIGSACIPVSSSLMTWDLGSSAFKMYLSRELVTTISEHITQVVDDFLGENRSQMDYWAIHPGGIRIVEAVKEKLGLTDLNVADSMEVLRAYGNMSSPTILFILERMLTNIRKSGSADDQKVFACAFGPGLTVEMMQFSSKNLEPSRPV